MTGNEPTAANQSMGLQIANAVVRLTNEYTGRGPSRARAYIHDDLISVVLRDTLTKGERSLVRDGKTELVLDTRKAYQQTMREEMVREIEEITGRTVIAFFSDNSVEPDTAIEAFLLAP